MIKGIKRKIKSSSQRFKDYWCGSVYVGKQYIYGDWPERKKLYTISIVASLYKKGAWFTDIEASSIADIAKSLCKKPKLNLRIDYGGGAYNSYTFNKYQQALLLGELKKILDVETFYKEGEDDG